MEKRLRAERLIKKLRSATISEVEKINEELRRMSYPPAEPCRKCGVSVSMLNEEGLCGACEYMGNR